MVVDFKFYKGIIMKKVLLLILVLSFVGCESKHDLKTDEDKTFYVVGSMFGSRLANLGLSDHEIDLLVYGLKTAAKGEKPAVEISKYQRKVQELFKKRMNRNSQKIKEEGEGYLKKFLAEEGVKKTESGLVYKILKEGEGKNPGATDVVEVHYHGTLIDGTVFDSSVDRGKKVSFPLNRVIKGWTEGLQLLKVGGKVRLVIPSNLGYGDHGAPPKIPGGATLLFDVELFSIKDKVDVPPKKKNMKKGTKKSTPKKKFKKKKK